MDKPWKVIFAFVGVFIAGAVFGGFFTLRTAGGRLGGEAGFKRQLGAAATAGSGYSQRGQGASAGQLTPGKVQVGTPTAVPAAPIPPGRIAPALMNQLTKRLSPTAEQKEKIKPIVGRAAEDIQRMQREHLQDTTRVSERMYEDVSLVLTAEQRTHLEKMRQEMHERVRKEREKRGELQTKSSTVRPNVQSAPGQAAPKVQQGP